MSERRTDPAAEASNPSDEGESGGAATHRNLRHELRTPLNQIIGYAEMLREDADLSRGDVERDLDRIAAAGRSLLALIDELGAEVSGASGSYRMPTPAALSSSADDAPGASAAELGGYILVVDDSEPNRDMLSRRLAKRGYEVATASGGREALESVEQRPPDLMLLDVMMPDISGLDVLGKVREKHGPAEVPIIMATARNTGDEVVAALRAGANDYVTKPLDFQVLLARSETHLALKRSRDQIAALHARLMAVQGKLDSLGASMGGRPDDVEAWARSVLPDLVEAIGGGKIGAWFKDGETVTLIAGHTAYTPTLTDLDALAGSPAFTKGSARLVPIQGIGGTLFGAIVVESHVVLDEGARRLVSSLARQLGGALEMKNLRKDLHDAARRQKVTREELAQRGMDIVQLCPKCLRCFGQSTTECPDDASKLESPQLLPWKVADRYELERLVGEGGMGSVFRARDARLERPVAVKVIKGEHFHDDNVRMRFEQEARTVARIDHPGVVGVFDSGELEGGSRFIVMEWLEGWDLGRVVRSLGPGNASEIVSLLRQAAGALDAAHAAQLVHRDIKPDNFHLMPAANGFRVKLLDFGVAKELHADTSLTQTGSLVGTPLYMSPEQILGKPVDARSDIYSLAAVMYYALTRARVVSGRHLTEVVYEVMTKTPRPPSDFVPVSAAVDAAFARALAKDPGHRPDTATAWVASFADELSLCDTRVPGWLDREGQLVLVAVAETDDPEPLSGDPTDVNSTSTDPD